MRTSNIIASSSWLICGISRIENLRDLVLYRFGSTGVHQVLTRAAELLGLTPVFPVRNISTFSSGEGREGGVFRDCVLVKKYVFLTRAEKHNLTIYQGALQSEMSIAKSWAMLHLLTLRR